MGAIQASLGDQRRIINTVQADHQVVADGIGDIVVDVFPALEVQLTGHFRVVGMTQLDV